MAGHEPAALCGALVGPRILPHNETDAMRPYNAKDVRWGSLKFPSWSCRFLSRHQHSSQSIDA